MSRRLAASVRTQSRVRLRGAAWTIACLVATALAIASGNRPAEYLDEETGATVAIVGQPLVFAREHAGLGRDYVTLAAAAVDQSGQLSYLLVGYLWSVGLSRAPKDTQLAASGVTLQADDRRVELTLQKRSAREFGIGRPVHRPPVGAAEAYVYLIDLATMELLAESGHLSLDVQDENAAVNYQLFGDGRAALKEFVRLARARFSQQRSDLPARLCGGPTGSPQIDARLGFL
jgi:hypothetical protein